MSIRFYCRGGAKSARPDPSRATTGGLPLQVLCQFDFTVGAVPRVPAQIQDSRATTGGLPLQVYLARSPFPLSASISVHLRFKSAIDLSPIRIHSRVSAVQKCDRPFSSTGFAGSIEQIQATLDDSYSIPIRDRKS